MTSVYATLDNWIDAEDFVDAATLPGICALMGESPTWRVALMGFVNQVLSRNLINRVGPKMEPVNHHSAKAMLAGALLPLEEIVFQGYRLGISGFFRHMSEGTVASLLASMIGPVLRNSMDPEGKKPPSKSLDVLLPRLY